MKKVSIFVLLVVGIVLTGCGKTITSDGMEIEKRDFGEITEVKQKKSSTETITCSTVQKEDNVTMNQKISLNFKSNKLTSASIVIDAKLDSKLLDYIDEFIDSLEEEFDGFEYDDVKIKKTSMGAKVTYSMDEDDFEDEYGSATTKSAIISEMEAAGYDCD